MQVISRASMYGCMLEQSGQRIFLSPVGRAPGFSLCTMLHSGIIRFYFIRLFPCIKQQPSPYMGRGLSYFVDLLDASLGNPMMRRQTPFKTVWKRVCFVPGHRSGTFKPQPIKPDFEPACNRSGPQAGNLLKRLEPCRRLGLGKTTAVCGTR